jgi:hypothetical protein
MTLGFNQRSHIFQLIGFSQNIALKILAKARIDAFLDPLVKTNGY